MCQDHEDSGHVTVTQNQKRIMSIKKTIQFTVRVQVSSSPALPQSIL